MGSRILRRLIIAALLSTTALVGSADRAHAGPVAAFLGGFLNALGAGTFLSSAAFVGSWTAGFSAASWLTGGSILARVVVAVGLSALAQGLMPKPQMPQMPQPAEAQANYAQDVTFCDFVYGEVRKGGPYAFSAFSSAAFLWFPAYARRHYGIIIAAHPTEGPVAHYLDDIEVEIAASGLVTTPPMANFGLIRTFNGGAGQVANPIWREIFPEVTAAHNFAGISYAGIVARRAGVSDAATVYTTGREWAYAPVWRGENRILDPRTGLRGWTTKAALVIADIATRW